MLHCEWVTVFAIVHRDIAAACRLTDQWVKTPPPRYAYMSSCQQIRIQMTNTLPLPSLSIALALPIQNTRLPHHNRVCLFSHAAAARQRIVSPNVASYNYLLTVEKARQVLVWCTRSRSRRWWKSSSDDVRMLIMEKALSRRPGHS